MFRERSGRHRSSNVSQPLYSSWEMKRITAISLVSGLIALTGFLLASISGLSVTNYDTSSIGNYTAWGAWIVFAATGIFLITLIQMLVVLIWRRFTVAWISIVVVLMMIGTLVLSIGLFPPVIPITTRGFNSVEPESVYSIDFKNDLPVLVTLCLGVDRRCNPKLHSPQKLASPGLTLQSGSIQQVEFSYEHEEVYRITIASPPLPYNNLVLVPPPPTDPGD